MEFTKYEKYGAYHWDEYNQPTIYRDHANRVKDWVKEKKVLDIGCGDGLITSLLKAKGIDNHKLAIQMAKDRGVDAEVGDVYTVTGKYDAVYLGDTLEHLDEPEKAINKISEITNVVYVVTPPKQNPYRPYHVREWQPEELVTWMAELGWEGNVEVANDRIYGRFTK